VEAATGHEVPQAMGDRSLAEKSGRPARCKGRGPRERPFGLLGHREVPCDPKGFSREFIEPEAQRDD